MRLMICVFALAGAALAQNAARFSILIAGNDAGKAIQTTGADGAVEIQYSYNDRGRGPEIHGRYRFDERGLPTSVELTGKDYYKVPVEERLTVKDGEARWRSASEDGQAAGYGFYISLNGPPVELGWLVNALQKSPTHSVTLFPGGQAHLEKGSTTLVKRQGKFLGVTEYLVTGLDFVPTPVWLDRDNHYFAAVSPWFSVVREGWESSVDDLIKSQDSDEDVRFRVLAQKLGKHPKSIVIRHARVFDSVNAVAEEGQTVWIDGDHIRAVRPDAEYKNAAGADVIDASGQTLLPGLWDMHVHTAPSNGLLNIASGVTSVRDMANDTDMLTRLRKEYDSGVAIGPRIFMAGFIDGRGPFQGPTKVFADNEAEARADIDKYASLGYSRSKCTAR